MAYAHERASWGVAKRACTGKVSQLQLSGREPTANLGWPHMFTQKFGCREGIFASMIIRSTRSTTATTINDSSMCNISTCNYRLWIFDRQFVHVAKDPVPPHIWGWCRLLTHFTNRISITQKSTRGVVSYRRLHVCTSPQCQTTTVRNIIGWPYSYVCTTESPE